MAANVLLNHPPDGRTYGIANAILQDLQLKQVRLLTNNPDKISQLESYNSVKVIERRPMIPRSWASTPQGESEGEISTTHLANPALLAALHGVPRSPSPSLGSPKKELDKYLAVKIKKMGHLLHVPEGKDS